MSAVLKERTPTANPVRFHEAGSQNNNWVFNAETGHTPDDIVGESYWAHVAEKLTPFDKIEVRAEDGSWIAFLLVTACERNWARVALLSQNKLNSSNEAPISSIRHTVEWKGPQLKFCVVRTADGEKVQTGFQDRAKAAEWLREHERTV